jgi:antitoxin component YwqK of YwqJK toxin-antitoxin module
MEFLMSWFNSQLILSRYLPGYVLCLMLVSCTREKKNIDEILIVKQVPARYFNSNDTLFSAHQDTVYYNGSFFSGYRFTLFANGDTAALQSYFNGVEEGLQRKWYPGKKLADERFYINGKKEGIHQGWWPDGKQKYFFQALHNEYNGEFKEWYTSGSLGKCFHYVNGKEEGSQRLWWENGSVRANYVIRNGKKYGLLGLKTCTNPYDSIYKK